MKKNNLEDRLKRLGGEFRHEVEPLLKQKREYMLRTALKEVEVPRVDSPRQARFQQPFIRYASIAGVALVLLFLVVSTGDFVDESKHQLARVPSASEVMEELTVVDSEENVDDEIGQYLEFVQVFNEEMETGHGLSGIGYQSLSLSLDDRQFMEDSDEYGEYEEYNEGV